MLNSNIFSVKKYYLPAGYLKILFTSRLSQNMEHTEEPIFIATGIDAPREELPFIEREAITAIVIDPKTKKYLGLKWKTVDWETFITGGVEEGQTPEQAARAEVLEETGYKNLKLVAELPKFHAKFYHHPKGVNRFAHFHAFLFELENEDREEVTADEQKNHDCIWLDEVELEKFRLPEGHRFLLKYIQK
jgi:8-oxo-dGTP pyrophosphatase MutT (NUDIX family)